MRLFTLISILCCVVFSSCQKEISIDTSTSSPQQGSKPKTYTEDYTAEGEHYAMTFALSYDGQGRLVSLISTTDPGNKFLYAYPQQNLFTMDLYNANELSIHEDFYLNSSSFIDSTFQYNDTKDTTTEKYVYNSNKQLIALKRYFYEEGAVVQDETTRYEYNDDGTLARETDGSTVTSYEYYADLENSLLLSLTPYTPVSPKLVKTTTVSSGGEQIVQQHSYTFDDQKRLTSETITIADQDVTVVKSYTY